MTEDVLLTLSLLLSAALAARFVASLIRVPEMLVLIAFGALIGPSVLDVVDVPFDSIGAQLIFTLGVADPFLRRAQPLASGPAPRLGRPQHAGASRRGADRAGHRRDRALAFDLS